MKPPRPTPRGARWVLAALAFPALALAGCSGRPAAVGVSRDAPVILISIDTLRADHLPAYGYQAVATPAIDGLRRDGILYTHAYSQTPLTLPSHTTILSGLLPEVHGVRDNVGYSLDDAKVRKGELPYLPEMLKKAGYATGGAVSAYVLRRKTGIAEGFDFFEDSIEFRTGTGLGGLQRPGSETLRLTLPWLRSIKDKPFFLFFHLYEPHAPYDPPEPYRSRYPSRYDGEIATADHVVGELLGELRTLGVYDTALIILLGDHGEGLGEHGEDEHGVLLYNEDIHVPLIVKLPGAARAGATVDEPAGLFDVAPTVAALVGLPRSPAWKGLPLTDLLRAAPPRRIYSETFYPRLHFGWSDLASLADGSHHLIEGPDPELYDLRTDPGERRNLRAADRRLYADFHQSLQGYDRTLAPPAAVDEETRKAMASLGYIGTAGATSGPLPDPKTRVASLADLKNAFQLMGEKRYPEAAQALRRVIDQNPLMADAWEYLGRAEQRLGDRDAALAAYIEALKVSGGAPHIALAVASIYFEMERYDEAAAHARMALGEHASFAHGMLARIALRRHQLDEAEREAKAAAAADQGGDRIGPTLTLAEVAEGRGRYDEALALTQQAEKAYEAREAKDPDLIQGLYLLRGTVLADQGDAPGAEAAFEKEIALFPDDPRAYSHLALLYALLGDGPKVGDTLRRMVEARPAPDSYVEAVRTLRVVRDEGGARRLLAYARQKFPRSDELRALTGGTE